MKRKSLRAVWIIIVILLITAIVAFYFYDVLRLKTPYTKNLSRAIAIIILLLGTLLKLTSGIGRQSLDIYEKAYKDELGSAFQDSPLNRTKLLCACRLYDESNYRKALKYLSQLLREAAMREDFIPIWLFVALCYTDAGVNTEAIRAYQELLKLDPYNAQAHSNVGILLMREGDFNSALAHYNKSIEINPKNYYAYINRANYYFRMSEYENAISDAKQALEFMNNGVEAASLLAIIYALLGDEENKKRYYHLAITAGKSPKDLNEAIEYFLSETRIPTEENA